MKSKTRGLLSFLLTLGMTFALLPAFEQTALAAWDGSSANISWYVKDTESSIFLISDEAELSGLSALVNAGTFGTIFYDSATGLILGSGTEVSGSDFSGKTIILTADLDLDEQAWEPIASNETNPFMGSFNGSGCIISRLSVNSSTNGGLFGDIGASGTVENLTVSGIITGTYSSFGSAGGIAATNYGTIKNCLNQCTINANGGNVTSFGGIVGENQGTVINCGNTGIITVTPVGSNFEVGGISGVNYKLILNCYNTGAISLNDTSYAFENCSGLASSIEYPVGYSSPGSIQNCYNKGTVKATNSVLFSYSGSLVGIVKCGTISECYWLTGTNNNNIGRSDVSFTNVHSFSTSGEFDSGSPVIDGKTCTDLTDALNALVNSGTNNQSYCYWDGSGDTPVFFTNWSEVAEKAKPDTDYTVSENDYTVQTALGLAYATSLVNEGYEVDSITVSHDIDLSGYQWTPIGTSAYPFTGTFDGGNHKIMNMLINTTSDNQGLFSFVQGGTVKNLMLTDCIVIGGSRCAGIVSSISDGSIQNCGVTGAIIGDTSGGIAAEISDSNMESCYTMAIMKGTNCGLVSAQGTNSSSMQNICYLSNNAMPGIGDCDDSVNDTTMGKDKESFANGEVAWLLDTYGDAPNDTHRGIWSRDANALVFADSTHQTIYRLLLQNSANPTAVYSAADGSVNLPNTPTHVDGYTFLGWFTDASCNNAYTAPSILSHDEIIYGSFITRIIHAEDYFAQYTGNTIDYGGTVTDTASEIVGASPLSYTYYTDSEGTIPTTPSNSGASSEGLAPVRAGMYYVKISAPETGNGSIKLKAASTLVRMKIKSKDKTDYYSVTAKQSTGGTIFVSNSTVEEGNSVTIKITPKDGYAISDVLMNGVSVGAVSSYTVKDMEFDITISAVYRAVDSKIDDTADIPDVKEGWSNPFTDVSKESWYYDSVAFVCKNNLFSGTSADTFHPESSMTRAMLVTVLSRLCGDTDGFTNAFSDIPSGSWYEQAVAWAAANSIVSGTGNRSFSPESNITHEQFIVILYNYAKYKGLDVSVGEDANALSFGDVSYLSNYAYPALQWACYKGILCGNENANINPQGFATRAEAAAMLQRFVEHVIG